MLQLHNLRRAVKKRKRVGRGGSRGGTAGRGHKGQSARSGGSVGIIFEGGQMPLSRRLPKRGFSNAPFKDTYEVINIDRLNVLFADGQTVSKAALVERGIIHKDSKLKILGRGTLDKKLIVEVDAISQSAREAVEKSGGKVKLTKEI